MTDSPSYWRKCSSCKKPIPFGSSYYVCSVSTCNRKRSQMVFCNIRCWDAHVPVMNHREASAEEKRAPSKAESEAHDTPSPRAGAKASSAGDVLVVASRVKSYIQNKSGMNTSASTMDALSSQVRLIADKAIQQAKDAGRETVMGRDIKQPEMGARRSNVVIRRKPRP